jgi:hypothetical protein
MRTRKDITLTKDKTGTHRALQQMKVGDYALFTDGSWMAQRMMGRDEHAAPLYAEEAAGWGVQVCQKGKLTMHTRDGTVAGTSIEKLFGRVPVELGRITRQIVILSLFVNVCEAGARS